MKSNYDFSKARKNPYAKSLKRQITIKLDPLTISYFKDLALDTGISYQNLMNFYLRDCAVKNKKPLVSWTKG